MVERALIYLVTNRVNGKTYVGVTKFSIEQRWRRHVWAAMREPKSWLHRSIAKYGADAFSVVPIASCLDFEGARQVERDVIRSFAPEYNQTAGGEFTVGRYHTPETKARLAAHHRGLKQTPEQRAANRARAKARHATDPRYRASSIGGLAKGRAAVDLEKRNAAVGASARDRVWSEASRSKLSASCMGRRYGQEVIDRMREKKKKAVECVDLNCSFDSVLEAAEATGVYFSNISEVCRGRRKTAGGMRFRFAQGEDHR